MAPKSFANYKPLTYKEFTKIKMKEYEEETDDRITDVTVSSKLPGADTDGDTPFPGYKYKYKSQHDRGYEEGVDAVCDAIEPIRVIYNPPATIVFWANGEKTVVKCSKGEKYNKYHGFCAALAKRVYGNNNQVTKIVNSGIEEKPEKQKSSKKKESKKK